MKKLNLAGKRFGKWTVVGDVGERSKSGDVKWLCQCECGNQSLVTTYKLRSGRSSGCKTCHMRLMGKLSPAQFKVIHGLYGTKEYNAWIEMKRRCLNPNATSYPWYGARGIKVCDKWLNDPVAFIEYIGKAPGREYSIDRINNNGDYEPGNVRWATKSQQAKNRR